MHSLRRWRPQVETLDSRILPAVTLNSGLLAIDATAQADVIDVRLVATDATKLQVSLNNQIQTFNVADVTSISIQGGLGADQITVGADVTVGVTVNGGKGDDTITVLANAASAANVLNGGLGNDTIVGGAGVDVIVGVNGNDNLQGGAGADFLIGGNGNDTIDGGAGIDLIVGGNGQDVIDGGADLDIIFGLNGKDILRGGLGDDLIFGGNGADQLIGEAGNDKLFGGNGPDRLLGGDGNDFFDGGNGPDTIDGGAGFDVAAKVDNNDTVTSVFEVDKELKATLSGAVGSATALLDFDVEALDTEVEFNLQVTGLTAQANTTVDVVIGGVVVGQIALDASGNGSLILSSDPDEADESLFPSNFPETLAAGATIQIRTAAAVVLLQGTFQVQ